jgi:hypothetical protein
MGNSVKSFITMAMAAVLCLVTFCSGAFAATNYIDGYSYRFFYSNSLEKSIAQKLATASYAGKAASAASAVLGGNGINWNDFTGSGKKIPVYLQSSSYRSSNPYYTWGSGSTTAKLSDQRLWLTYGVGTNVNDLASSAVRQLVNGTSQLYFLNKTKLYQNSLFFGNTQANLDFQSYCRFFMNAFSEYTAYVTYPEAVKPGSGITSQNVRSLALGDAIDGLDSWQRAHKATASMKYREQSLAVGYWMVNGLGNVSTFVNSLYNARLNKFQSIDPVDSATQARLNALAPFANAFYQTYKLRYNGPNASDASTSYRNYWGF